MQTGRVGSSSGYRLMLLWLWSLLGERLELAWWRRGGGHLERDLHVGRHAGRRGVVGFAHLLRTQHGTAPDQGETHNDEHKSESF